MSFFPRLIFLSQLQAHIDPHREPYVYLRVLMDRVKAGGGWCQPPKRRLHSSIAERDQSSEQKRMWTRKKNSQLLFCSKSKIQWNLLIANLEIGNNFTTAKAAFTEEVTIYPMSFDRSSKWLLWNYCLFLGWQLGDFTVFYFLNKKGAVSFFQSFCWVIRIPKKGEFVTLSTVSAFDRIKVDIDITEDYFRCFLFFSPNESGFFEKWGWDYVRLYIVASWKDRFFHRCTEWGAKEASRQSIEGRKRDKSSFRCGNSTVFLCKRATTQ